VKKLSVILVTVLAVGLAACSDDSLEPTALDSSGEVQLAKSSNGNVRINVVLNTAITEEILADLGNYGRVKGQILELNAVFMRGKESVIPTIQALPYVDAANPDAKREAAPLPPFEAFFGDDATDGMNTWNLDAVNVTDCNLVGAPGEEICDIDNNGTRQVAYDGSGVYVAVLDTGLLQTWPFYLPSGQVATHLGKAFQGGAGGTNVAEPTNKWQHDTDSHGTHVTSIITGYAIPTSGTFREVNGVAPGATIIPVKVLNQNGSGWSSMVAAGIVYIGELKRDGILDGPVVINMSLGGSVLDAVEKAAMDFAIREGVVIVASAGNRGVNGMGFPGAYTPVISVAAAGFVGEWFVNGNLTGTWWRFDDIADPDDVANLYITDFSSRELTGQDLDVAAPGSWVVGPWQLQMGNPSWFFIGGTSQAAPHVAGIAALMLQKNSSLDSINELGGGVLGEGPVETILQGQAIPMPPGCRNGVFDGFGSFVDFCWGADAAGAGFITADGALGGA
jgi:subtilisin family serine protease